EVIAAPAVACGRLGLEPHPRVDTRIARTVSRGRDRAVVVIDADELRGFERAGHQDRRRAVATADVRHSAAALELGEHAPAPRPPPSSLETPPSSGGSHSDSRLAL